MIRTVREIYLDAQKAPADFGYLPYLADSQGVKGEGERMVSTLLF